MPELEEWYRLSQTPGGAGLNCEESGVSLAGVALLRKTDAGLAPRPAHEIEALIKGAYGRATDVIRLESGLRVASEALNRGDIGRAMIATVLLRLPELRADGVASISRVDDVLAKYNPDEPRDWRGRWTTGGPQANTAKPQPRTPLPSGPSGRRRGLPDLSGPTASSAEPTETDAAVTAPSQSWGGPTHLYGGQVTNTVWPENESRDETKPETDAEPNFNASKVPQGFDTPGHIAGGLEYQPSRHPTLPNGEPWPEATPEHVLALLRLQPGRPPFICVFVPIDGRGPVLLGSTPEQSLREPEGYETVYFRGRPQFTPLGNGESPHALESVIEGLRMAKLNRFSDIFFNSEFQTIARYVQPQGSLIVESIRRPDVAGIIKPSVELPHRIEPFEILSDRQTLEGRRKEVGEIPGVKLIDGRTYKRFMNLDLSWFEQMGVRLICL